MTAQGGPCAHEAQAVGHRGDAEDTTGFGRGQAVESGKGERLLVGSVEFAPGRREIHARDHGLGIRSGWRRRRHGVREVDGERLRAVDAPPGVEEAVAGDAEGPGPLSIQPWGRFVVAAPGHEEGVGDDIGGVRRMDPALDEAQQVRDESR